VSMQYAPPPTASGPSGPRAGFWRRFAAYFVDGIIVGVVSGIIFVAAHNTGLLYAVGFLFGLLYFSYCYGSPSGQTIGMRLLGIRVYDFNGRGPIGFGRGVLRYIGLIISGIPCYLGFLWMLWDREKQTWADKIANTVVVPVSAYPVG
jgi:uncharacterized RDD family membrane protein YckC